VEEMIAHSVSLAETEAQARRVRASWQDRPTPELLPAYGEIYADELGCLWVEEYRSRASHDPHRFTIFDAEGRLAGSLVVPPSFEIVEIGEDYLLGTWWDDLDVEYLRVYGLTRPGGP
jgi:hypothetical protein